MSKDEETDLVVFCTLDFLDDQRATYVHDKGKVFLDREIFMEQGRPTKIKVVVPQEGRLPNG